MLKIKQQFVNLLRRLHLLQLVDNLRYLLALKSTRKLNREFQHEHPDFIFPPSFLSYDAYGHTNYPVYYYTGIAHAKFISKLISENLSGKSLSICEWGCGPSRILRHIPDFFEHTEINLQGYDYNKRSIKWCSENIPAARFELNSLNPPLPCNDASFDCIYNLSVFTHLSEGMHYQWMNELVRAVKPGGLIIITTHGDYFKNNLIEKERTAYDAGNIVIRDGIEEGKRCYVAFHPKCFITNKLLPDGVEVISHYPGPVLESLQQDVWVLRNKT